MIWKNNWYFLFYGNIALHSDTKDMSLLCLYYICSHYFRCFLSDCEHFRSARSSSPGSNRLSGHHLRPWYPNRHTPQYRDHATSYGLLRGSWWHHQDAHLRVQSRNRSTGQVSQARDWKSIILDVVDTLKAYYY